jgi:hypothetical protein
MLITEEMIGTALISIITTSLVGYAAFRTTLESRMKDLEHEIELLKPIKNIILQKGSEQVEKVFREEEK